MADTSKIRGIRNNNPGNIRHSNARWQGLADEQLDKSFVTFKEPRFGIRAMAATLITYHDKRLAANGTRIDTVEEVIQRWAPPNENETHIYASYVAAKHPKGLTGTLDLHKYEDMQPLVEAIIAFENHGHKYPRTVIDAGLKLAGIEPVRNAARTSEAVGGMVGGSGLAGQMFIDAAQQMQVMGPEGGNTMRWVFLGLMMTGFLISIIGWYRKWRLQGPS